MHAIIALVLLLASATPKDDALIATEKSMWQMWKQKDARSFAALLADDFYDVYLSGETAGKKELLQGFGDSDLLGYDLSPIKVVAVAPDVRVLLYRAHIRGRVAGKKLEYDVDVTSAWSPRNGTWKSVFYRENLVPKTLPWTKL